MESLVVTNLCCLFPQGVLDGSGVELDQFRKGFLLVFMSPSGL